MHIFITGGAGFIGFHLTQRLLADGHTITSVDNLSDYYDVQLKKDRLQLLEHDNFTFIQMDILEREKLEKIFSDNSFDCIVHLAALAGVRYALDHGIEYVRTNYEGTFNIFEMARNYGSIKVVYASSSSVYGSQKESPLVEHMKVDEPYSLYGATKKANEEMAYSYYHLFKVPSIGLRFFTVYGPYGRPDMALMLFTEAILKRKPIDVFNYGKQNRDFTYVDDIVSGIAAAIEYNTDYEIFNLGSGKAVPLMEFIETIEKHTGLTAEKNMLPPAPGDVSESLADIRKAEKLLGYTPSVFVDKGVERVVSWFKKHYNYE